MRCILLTSVLLLPLTAFAQNASDQATQKRAALDKLLGALKAAPSEEVAEPLEERIKQIWL